MFLRPGAQYIRTKRLGVSEISNQLGLLRPSVRIGQFFRGHDFLGWGCVREYSATRKRKVPAGSYWPFVFSLFENGASSLIQMGSERPILRVAGKPAASPTGSRC